MVLQNVGPLAVSVWFSFQTISKVAFSVSIIPAFAVEQHIGWNGHRIAVVQTLNVVASLVEFSSLISRLKIDTLIPPVHYGPPEGPNFRPGQG